METIEELQEFVQRATQDDIRGKLLARGETRAIIRRNGQLPEEAPQLGETLDIDLSEYGFSLLRASMALREKKGEPKIWSTGFLKAGNAFEALVRNGSSENPQRGFWRVMGSSSYHLAGYSAMAYSLIKQHEEEPNFAPGEFAIVYLLLRDLKALRHAAQIWLREPEHQDDDIQNKLAEGIIDIDDALVKMLTTTIYKAYAFFEFALATGDEALHTEAITLLNIALNVASDSNAISLWWIIRIALNLIDDLWTNSLHHILPDLGPEGSENYEELRGLFLASLYARNLSEIELWPSQLDAAKRAIDLEDDLVVSLPTSAGKTRIAEICALMSLSINKRVLIVTPLRSLSAQMERAFRRTFGPLGFSVSSLYGASVMAPGDDDALRTRNIVIATPEKLDFALRNDPTLIDNIGLIVLDEGHLIGPSEREIRYEILVQRLLRRSDTNNRRIVCLSAILPEGEQLDDLTSWIRSDAAGNPVKSDWRPTRQRFGTLTWTGQSARLTFDINDDGPFIPGFLRQQPPIKPRRKPFPSDNPELTLAAAWKFYEEDKRTLVFCAQRNNVESYAKKIVDLANRVFLTSLLSNPTAVDRARTIGSEWLGVDHPAVKCLNIGVAIHHARLPNPFLREVERLLNDGVLMVTVASPTIAQGLNLNAAVLLIPTLYRAGVLLPGEQFSNVAGRAGRAFVDLEGLVVHVMYEPVSWRKQVWHNLVNSSKAHSLESGLIQIANKILERLARDGILNSKDAFEYLANSRESWDINDKEGDEPLEHLLEKLDNTILGLVEALDAETADLPQLIDEALNSSLWARQIARRTEEKELQLNLLKARAKLIWSCTSVQQRRGHFAMGVGLKTGLALDSIAEELEVFLDEADNAALSGDIRSLQEALANLAKRLLNIRPFSPNDPLPENWQEILSSWLAGKPVQEIGTDNMRFIEDVFTYRLIWAIEAIRMRRIAMGWEQDIITGGSTACLETGVPKFVMAMLVRAGLPSRAAAIIAVNDLNPIFVDNSGLLEWLKTNEVKSLTDKGDWPTAETATIWKQFRSELLENDTQKWFVRERRQNIAPKSIISQPVAGKLYRVEVDDQNNSVWICTPDFHRIAKLQHTMIDPKPSVLSARFEEESSQFTIRRFGHLLPTWSEL